jgi:hypothetical protein
MNLTRICLLLVLAPGSSVGEAPESILGTWHFDLVRTMTEHIDRVAQARPDLISAEAAALQKSQLPELAKQARAQATVTITEDTIISRTGDDRIQSSYRVIGGNSALVMIESTDEEGYTSVTHVRLVDGGIAIETTNCQEQPEQCERERRRAVEQLSNAQRQSSVPTDEPGAIAAMGSAGPLVDGAGSPQRHDGVSQPKWVYFKQAADE